MFVGGDGGSEQYAAKTTAGDPKAAVFFFGKFTTHPNLLLLSFTVERVYLNFKKNKIPFGFSWLSFDKSLPTAKS